MLSVVAKQRTFALFFVFLGILILSLTRHHALYTTATSGSFSQNFLNSFVFQQDASVVFPEEALIEENSFLGFSSPVNIANHTFAAKTSGFISYNPEPEIKEYIVQKGDSISSIAKRFHVSVETILWSNNLSSQSIIKPGQKLVILPVSGVLHLVKKGDTISSIAKTYQADKEEILSFNHIEDEGKIYVGDLLIVPGGKMPKKTYASSRVVNSNLPATYFICPIPSPCRITQGLHWYNAVDFSNGKCGEPVYAVAGGTIQRTGYNKIAGNYIRILHPNGVITFYGHLSKILVNSGQKVSQGQIIGYTGYSGYTIPAGPRGCHLHFDVRGARNPFAK